MVFVVLDAVVGLDVLVALLKLLLLSSGGGGLSGARCLDFLVITGDNGGRDGVYRTENSTIKLVAGRVSVVVVGGCMDECVYWCRRKDEREK